jgi:hypothetical protein
MTATIPAFFDRYEWSYEAVDKAIWRTTFATEREEDFDLYVAHSDDWIHFAVSPFTPLPQSQCRPNLYKALVELNQQIRLARFGVDADGDVNLLVDLPAAIMNYDTFATVLDTLVYYTQQLAYELARTATEQGYQSPLF